MNIKNYGASTHQTDTYEIGSILQGNVDLVDGNLTIDVEDFAWGGLRLPVTLKHFYNSDLANYQYSNNPSISLNVANFSAMKIGNGWRLNFMQSMVDDGVNFIYTDENGNITKFLPTTESHIFKSEENDGALYNAESQTLDMGEEVYTFDHNGRLIKIEDKHSNKILVNYLNNRIAEIQDGAGRNFTFAYNSNGFLTSVTAPDGSMVSYEYDNTLLERIIFPDGKVIAFGWGDNPKINVTALLDSNTSESNEIHIIEYAYKGEKIFSAEEYDVTKEYTFSATGESTSVLTYRANEETTKTDYTFDENGEIVNSYTNNVNVVKENGETITTVKVSEDIVIQNLLSNHSFEKGVTGWTATSVTSQNFNYFNSESEYCYIGKSALGLYGNDIPSNEPQGVYQQTEVLPKGEYTFSAYMRVNSFNKEDAPYGFIRVSDTEENILAVSETIDKYDTSYYRLTATFTLESDIAVKAELLMYGTGYVYADAVQLEKGAFANDYNIFENSDFSRDTTDWSNTNFSTEDYFSGTRSLKLTAPGGAQQTVYCDSSLGTRETFTLSGWAKAPDILSRGDYEYPQYAQSEFHMRVDLEYIGGSGEGYSASFSGDTGDWQYVELQFAKKNHKKIKKMVVYLTYANNPGSAYFDNLCLVRNSIETGLNSDDFEEEEEITEQSATPATVSEETETEQPVAHETSDESVENTAPSFEEAFDSAGNPLTETTFQDGEFGTIYRAFGYDSAKNNLVSETDSLGNVTAYQVNPTTSRNEVVTDRLGNKTTYEYDISGRTTKVTSKRADDTEIANVSYAYDALDNLTEIARGDGMKYNLSYNAFHQLQSIGIEGKDEKLINYSYKNAGGKVTKIAYANGDRMEAIYNGKGDLIAEKWYNLLNTLTAHYVYTYDDKGNILRSIDIFALKEYNYTYQDDKITRATEYNITLSEDFIVTSKTVVNTIRYYYNEDGELTCKRIWPYGKDEQVIYFEKGENEAEVLKSEIAHTKYLSHSKTDNFGRKVFEEVQFGRGSAFRKFEYLDGECTDNHHANNKVKSAPTTQLVSKITLSNGRTLEYSYDAEERITRIVDSAEGTTCYTYDALGQLLTETVNGAVKTAMSYDNYGNIRSKNGVEYIYDGVWKDKLVRVGDKSISYDAQGNPLTYLGHNLTWEKGRQLKSFDNNTYTYNANGIRTSKYVKSTDAVHKYTLDGTKILREEWTEHHTSMGNVISTDYYLEPIYDNEDSVTGINFCGSVYFFRKNLQGDIIEIVNSYNGKTVAKYSYDAWGKCTIDPTTTDSVIAERNPFRYRGYYFDTETDLYYLQSRYYDANTGRFVNGDMAEFAFFEQNILSHNLFGYCGNDSVNNVDYNGYYTASSLKKKSWLFSLASNFGINIGLISRTIKKQFFRINLWLVKLIFSVSVGLTKNYKAGVSFNFTKNSIGVSANLGMGAGYSLAFAYALSWTNITRSMSLVYASKNDGVYVSFDVEFQINHIATAAVAVACAYWPALSPVLYKLLAKSRTAAVGAMSVLAPIVRYKYA